VSGSPSVQGVAVFDLDGTITRRDTLVPYLVRALARLRACALLVNHAVGDALSDLLLVEAVLAVRGWGANDSWHRRLARSDATARPVDPTEALALEPSHVLAEVIAAVLPPKNANHTASISRYACKIK
jgi:phosphoserine phosphatase